jgi:hypothetical protein
MHVVATGIVWASSPLYSSSEMPSLRIASATASAAVNTSRYCLAGVVGVGQQQILNRVSLGEPQRLVGRLRRDRDGRGAGRMSASAA